MLIGDRKQNPDFIIPAKSVCICLCRVQPLATLHFLTSPHSSSIPGLFTYNGLESFTASASSTTRNISTSSASSSTTTRRPMTGLHQPHLDSNSADEKPRDTPTTKLTGKPKSNKSGDDASEKPSSSSSPETHTSSNTLNVPKISPKKPRRKSPDEDSKYSRLAKEFDKVIPALSNWNLSRIHFQLILLTQLSYEVQTEFYQFLPGVLHVCSRIRPFSLVR